eukprot:scaffold35427_cov21-Prasinocladus_malaysianus.AAC.1
MEFKGKDFKTHQLLHRPAAQRALAVEQKHVLAGTEQRRAPHAPCTEPEVHVDRGRPALPVVACLLGKFTACHVGLRHLTSKTLADCHVVIQLNVAFPGSLMTEAYAFITSFIIVNDNAPLKFHVHAIFNIALTQV